MEKGQGSRFLVSFDGEDDTSQRYQLDGVYSLLLTDTSICLCPLSSPRRVLHEWQYRHVRRYGKTRQTFLFVAGRSCPLGEGIVEMQTTHGYDIVNEIDGIVDRAMHGTCARDSIGDKQQTVFEHPGQIEYNPHRGPGGEEADPVYSEPYCNPVHLVDRTATDDYLTAIPGNALNRISRNVMQYNDDGYTLMASPLADHDYVNVD